MATYTVYLSRTYEVEVEIDGDPSPEGEAEASDLARDAVIDDASNVTTGKLSVDCVESSESR